TTTITNTIIGDEKDILLDYHSYYRRKLVSVGNWGIVHTGSVSINGKTIVQIIQEICDDIDSVMNLQEIETLLKEGFQKELQSHASNDILPIDEINLTLGLVGYESNNPMTKSFYFIKTKEGLIETKEKILSTGPGGYGISYYGDHEFIRLVIRTAIKNGLLKPFQILTLQEALDLSRILLRFLIDFQKFMIRSTVDYPIESAVITKDGGFRWVDQMEVVATSDIIE
ncbi:MAG: hypothetical protein PVG65_02565, partial [Candidatus Thorarchaeota archaeon]